MKSDLYSQEVSAPTSQVEKLVPSTKPEIIDRMGAIEEQLERLTAEAKARSAPLKDEYEKLEAVAKSWFTGPADESALEEGGEFLCKASPRQLKREVVDPLKLFKISRLNVPAFLKKFCNIKLGVIDKSIPEEKRPLFLKEERSGERSLTLVRKQPQASTAPAGTSALPSGPPPAA